MKHGDIHLQSHTVHEIREKIKVCYNLALETQETVYHT